MREDGADTPYDNDHILASAHLIKQCTAPWATDLDETRLKMFKDRRWFYLNSLGNFRIWPLWANRSDGKNAPTRKLRLDATSSVKDPHEELGLNGGEDFLLASSIDPAHRCLWLNASDEPFQWPKERREAWQKAVECRTVWLYRTLYNALGYSAWQ